jgi:hypothetical protein
MSKVNWNVKNVAFSTVKHLKPQILEAEVGSSCYTIEPYLDGMWNMYCNLHQCFIFLFYISFVRNLNAGVKY